AYGEFRAAQGRPRGKFVHIEPRMSLTAANSDEWIPARPGTEAAIALAIASVVVRENLIKSGATRPASPNALDRFGPEIVAEQVGVPAEELIRLAREFAAAERAIALPGVEPHELNLTTASAVGLLNDLVGNRDKPGGVFNSNGGTSPIDAVL